MALLRERLRARRLSHEQLELAVLCGHPAAIAACDVRLTPFQDPHALSDCLKLYLGKVGPYDSECHTKTCFLQVRECLVRVSLAVLSTLDGHDREVRNATTLLREWIGEPRGLHHKREFGRRATKLRHEVEGPIAYSAQNALAIFTSGWASQSVHGDLVIEHAAQVVSRARLREAIGVALAAWVLTTDGLWIRRPADFEAELAWSGWVRAGAEAGWEFGGPDSAGSA